MITSAMDLGMLASIGLIIASLFAGLLFGLWKKHFSDRDKKAVVAGYDRYGHRA